VTIEVQFDLDDATDGFVVKWYKRVGEQIVEGETLVEVTTDKVNVDITSPVTGTVKELHFEEEDRVNVGDLLAVIEAD
jgi:pyruvate/2-oxoglutarate dehydrogenase complex dihydrolipoamide acyltransferase (E2) component